MSPAPATTSRRAQIVARRRRHRGDARSSPASAAATRARSWLPDGSLLYVSDADGWFQVVRLTRRRARPDRPDRRRARARRTERRASATSRCRRRTAPGSSTSRSTTACPGPRRRELAGGRAAEARSRPAAEDAPDRDRGRRPAGGSTRGTACGERSAGSPDGAWVAAIGESETRPQDLWLLPVPGVAPDGARPRQVTDSLPAVLRAALAPGRVAGDRADRVHGPRRAADRRQPVATRRARRASAAARRVPTIV